MYMGMLRSIRMFLIWFFECVNGCKTQIPQRLARYGFEALIMSYFLDNDSYFKIFKYTTKIVRGAN